MATQAGGDRDVSRFLDAGGGAGGCDDEQIDQNGQEGSGKVQEGVETFVLQDETVAIHVLTSAAVTFECCCCCGSGSFGAAAAPGALHAAGP